MQWQCGLVFLAAASEIFIAPQPAYAQQQKQNLCNEGKGDAAIAACTDLIRRGGKDLPILHYNRSLAWESKEECDLALADAEKALSLRRDEIYYVRLGSVLAECKYDLERALPIYDQGIKAWPNAASLYNRRAILQQQRADHQRALADANQTILLKPDEAAYYVQRGVIFADQEDYDKAIADFATAIRTNPKQARGYSNRGYMLCIKGDRAGALADFDRASRTDARDSLPYLYRAACHREAGEYDQALPQHAKAIELSRSPNNYNSRARTYRMKGELDLALADANEAVKIAPRDLWSRIQRGITYRYRGEHGRAIEDFNFVLREYPYVAMAYVERGRAFEKEGELARARDDFESALKERGVHFKTAHEDARAQLASLDAGAASPAVKIAPATAAAPAVVAPSASIAPVITKDQGRRVALVIGNGEYAHTPKLANPSRDAKAVANSLRTIGFQSVTVASDLSREGLIVALRNFAREAEKADWVMVYYAGHGIEVGGVNYLIPVDAKLETDRDTALEAVSLEQVLSAVDGARKIKLVVLDACRDNPFAAQMRRSLASRSMGRGLGRVEPEGATLVVYAAKHGQTALDGDGANSPFASALVKRMATPDIEINKIFRLIRDDVMEATAGRQEPFTYGSLPGREDFYFVSAK